MSSNIKCFNCKKEFPSEEFNKHELECVSHFYQNEMENLIPCDVCNTLIMFDQYEQHINFCGLSQPIYFPIIPPTVSILNTSSTSIVNINNEEETGEVVPQLIEDEIIENNDIELPINLPGDLVTNINLLMNSQNALLSFINNIEQSNQSIDTYEELTLLDNNKVTKGIKVNDISKEVFYEEFNCPLCFDDFNKEDIILQLKCKHELCLDCGKEWFFENNKCPICMVELDNS
jgi:hypothetical protein